MSLGIQVMEKLVAMASKILGDGFDAEIVEKHHRMKADSPSGTALMLYESVKNARNNGGTPVHGRCGRNEKREKGDIGLHAVRGGTVTGEHEAGFYGQGEQLVITHRAESRALFAAGALKAARFLIGKPAGLYTMRDVVAELMG
jgi:4-hydroxy-tetrahydrodipicolinate reductase